MDALLSALAAQDYPEFEVVVVDDGSTDGTADVVRNRASGDRRVRLVSVDPVEPRKKHAVAAGIEAARFDLIALTDADCRPPNGWLAEITRHYGAETRSRIVIGYGPYDRRPTLLNRVARYENLVTSFLTAAACGLDRPYMAVGRNISYPRSLFERVGGLEGTMMSLSGDDDLFIQQAVRLGDVDVIHMLTPGSAVPSPAPRSWGSWLRQKQRHASAGRYYRVSVSLHLSVFHLSGIGLWIAPFYLGWVGVALLALRMAAQHIVLRRAATVFHERDLLPLQPLWELTYALYNLLVAPVGLLFKPREWRTGGER